MKDWRKNELTAAPADADLVFEIPHVSGISDSQMCLSIVDAKTPFILWPFIQHLQSSTRETSRRKSFDAARVDLIAELKGMTTLVVSK